MNPASIKKISDAPEYGYHLLRGALETYQKNIADLNSTQFQQTKRIADKTYAMESIVLSTPEARDIVIPESKLDASVQEIASRYTDRASFLLDLENNGLDESILRSALYRELLFDAVLASVTARAPQVSDVDIQLFYQLHKDRFTKPEKRKARHILITVNPDYPENDRPTALARVTAIAEKLKTSPGRFEALAKKHSECPTAMEGGKLGELTRGVLYPALDTQLFTMNEMAISPVIETEMGFHILLCEKIYKSTTVPLFRAKERIKGILQERQRRICQKAWLEKIQGEKHG